MTPDLLIPATTALLDGWRGPVTILDHVDWCEIPVDGVVLDTDPRGLALIAYRLDATDIVREVWMEIEFVVVDCGRAECRDRVARVLAAALLVEVPPNGDGFVWRAEFLASWTLISHNANWRAGFAADTSGWCGTDEGNRTGRFPSRSVPALAAIDPHDDARLPDGSRRVDAVALAAVARATFITGDSQ